MRLLETSTFEPEPLFVCDGDGLVAALNIVARTAAELRRGLFLNTGGLLSFSKAADQAAFQRLLAQAGAPPASGPVTGLMRFAVTGEPDPNTLVVSRLPPQHGGSEMASFAVVAHYRLDVLDCAPDPLTSAFEFTRAERAVAMAILRGQRLTAHAKALGVSHEAVRWHAKNMLSKAGCASQIEFVRLAQAISRPVAWDITVA